MEDQEALTALAEARGEAQYELCRNAAMAVKCSRQNRFLLFVCAIFLFGTLCFAIKATEKYDRIIETHLLSK
jgi:hypothetical protein